MLTHLVIVFTAPRLCSWLHTSLRLFWVHVLESTDQPRVLGLNFWLSVLPPITKTIQVRRTRHAWHCWRNKDELIREVLLWTPAYGRAKAGRPARTYLQQLCENTGCSPEDQPEAMNDREKWVRDIRASGTTWWWWWWFCHRGSQ